MYLRREKVSDEAQKGDGHDYSPAQTTLKPFLGSELGEYAPESSQKGLLSRRGHLLSLAADSEGGSGHGRKVGLDLRIKPSSIVDGKLEDAVLVWWEAVAAKKDESQPAPTRLRKPMGGSQSSVEQQGNLIQQEEVSKS